MSYYKTISINRTTEEWKVIDKKVNDSDSDNFGEFLRIKLKEFMSEYEDCPDCVTLAKGKRIQRRPNIYLSQIKFLEQVAIRMDLPISVIVDRLIIEPMLQPPKKSPVV